MRSSARRFIHCLLLVVLFVSLSLGVASQASAQTFTQPNLDSNVPRNQHTLAQATLIEVFLSVGCVLTGIDLSNPQTPCLDINPQTKRIGYAPSTPSQDGQVKIGGLLGSVTTNIATMYTPTTSTIGYLRYVASDFGIVKTAHAAPIDGFDGLRPVLALWGAARNISYFFLIIAFIFIGIGVMLRIRIDPRTVMTIQNQIPRVIIAILLIAFSYAIAALMIDLMWTVTYLGINVITTYGADPSPAGGGCPKLSVAATTQILQSPLNIVDEIFRVNCDQGGILALSKNVANGFSGLERDLILQFLGIDPGAGFLSSCVSFLGGSFGKCIGVALADMVGFIADMVWFLVAFIIIIITLFRIWFELLKAYGMILIYTILAPLFIVINLLPKRPLGFERWLRVYFVNLAIFPATVCMLVLARVFIELFSTAPQDKFLPPLIGNPGITHFGGLLAFALLLMTPHMLSLMKEKLGVPPVKQVAAAGAVVMAGAAGVGGTARKTWGGWNKRNATTGAAEAPISRIIDKSKTKIASKLGSNSGPRGMIRKWGERIENRNAGYGHATRSEAEERYGGKSAQGDRQKQTTQQPPAQAGGPQHVIVDNPPVAPTGGPTPTPKIIIPDEPTRRTRPTTSTPKGEDENPGNTT